MNRVLAAVIDYTNPSSLGSRLRRRRLDNFTAMLDSLARSKRSISILDIGGTGAYWNLMPPEYIESRNLRFTILNLPGRAPTSASPRFELVTGDACHAEMFGDNAFDMVHSNSVLEHVGDWPRMMLFAQEVRRLAPCYFVQTPNFWFPVEPHFMCPFFHWMPEMTRARLLTRVSLGNHPRASDIGAALRSVQSARLLNRAAFGFLFPDARIITERFCLLPKSLIACRDAAS